MHIAYLDPFAVPGLLPPSIQMLHTADALAGEVERVTLMTAPAESGVNESSILGRNVHANLHLHAIQASSKKLGFKSNKPFYKAAVAALKKINADVVLVRNLKMAAAILNSHPGMPVLFETHEYFTNTFASARQPLRFKDKLKLTQLKRREGFVYRHVDGLFALTGLLIEDIRKAYDLSTPCVVLPDAVDIEAAEQARPYARTSDRPRLLYLGSLHPWKGVDIALKAMAHVDAELCIVGGTQQRITELKALADQLALSNRIEFVGPVPPCERYRHIKSADICLLPLRPVVIGSRYTSPLKLFEYMASKVPIVISDLPSIREVVTSGQEVVGVKPGDVQSLADGINRLLSDSQLQEDLVKRAFQKVQSYSWQSRARRMVDFINQ